MVKRSFVAKSQRRWGEKEEIGLGWSGSRGGAEDSGG